MIKFVIKITTKDNLVLTGKEQEASSPQVFNAFIDGVFNSIGSGNFKLTDDDDDVIIIPQEVINSSIVQIIKTNNVNQK